MHWSTCSQRDTHGHVCLPAQCWAFESMLGGWLAPRYFSSYSSVELHHEVRDSFVQLSRFVFLCLFCFRWYSEKSIYTSNIQTCYCARHSTCAGVVAFALSLPTHLTCRSPPYLSLAVLLWLFCLLELLHSSVVSQSQRGATERSDSEG